MLETSRLILRPYEERDYDDLYELLFQRKDDLFEAYPDITYENTRELGYIVNKNYQRRGIAREAASAILTEAFSKGLHRVYAECDPRNDCSWGLLESLGFRREALLKQNIWFRKDEAGNPIWQDTCVYGLLDEEWTF